MYTLFGLESSSDRLSSHIGNYQLQVLKTQDYWIRLRQNLDQTGSDHGSDHVNWNWKFCATIQTKVYVTKWSAGPAGSFLFCPRTPCSHFHGFVEECCVVPPWTDASERYVTFHQSIKKNATQSTVPLPAREAWGTLEAICPIHTKA